jgi:hypothetical protein
MRAWLAAHYDLLKDFAGPAVTLIGFVVTIVLGIIGFSTFGRWRRQEIEQRRMDIAFEALNIAYKTRHVFDHIRGAMIYGSEWADMPQVFGDDDHKRTRRGSYYAIRKRLEAHKEFFESVWEVHAKCMAMFGPQVEEIFLELHQARRGVEIAIEALIRHLDDAPMTPESYGRFLATIESGFMRR